MPHTIIKNCLCYTEDYDCNPLKYYKIDIELIDESHKTTTYWDKKNRWGASGSIGNGKLLPEYGWVYILDGIENNMLLLDFFEKLKLNYNDYISIKNHCRETFPSYFEEEKRIRGLIYEKACSILKQKELATYLYSFIDKVSIRFFTDTTIMNQIDYYLYRKYLGFLLFSDEISRLNDAGVEEVKKTNDIPVNLIISESYNVKAGITTNTKIRLRDENIVSPYLTDYFDNLATIIEEEIDFSDTNNSIRLSVKKLALGTTYIALNLMCRIKFSIEWENEYGEHFKNIENMSLTEAISIYQSIDVIDHKSMDMAGKFIYCLMNNDKFSYDNFNYFLCKDEFWKTYTEVEKWAINGSRKYCAAMMKGLCSLYQ